MAALYAQWDMVLKKWDMIQRKGALEMNTIEYLKREIGILQERVDRCISTEQEEKRLEYLLWRYCNPIEQDSKEGGLTFEY